MTDDIIIETIKPQYAEALAQLQEICLPMLGEDELLKKEHFLKHCEIFPEGSVVAFVDGELVGLGSGFLCDFDFDNPHHRFMDFIAGGYYTNHDPDGDWYYGADVTVHPDYRRRGIGSKLYEVRLGIIKKLNKKGMVAGGLIPGYADYRDALSPEEYAHQVAAGELYDPTLSFQLKHGFELRGMLEDYLEDEASDNWATLIVWENPDYQPDQP